MITLDTGETFRVYHDGKAETAEAAAREALGYEPELKEFAGRRWWQNYRGWLSPLTCGRSIKLDPDESYGWTWTIEAADLPAMLQHAYRGDLLTFRGTASTLEEAASLALTAGDRFRAEMREFLGDNAGNSDYAEGYKAGRAAVFAEIAALQQGGQ